MKRREKNCTCLLCEFKPKIVKDDQENEDQKEEINEKIEQIKKNKTRTLPPKPKDKTVI